MAKTDDPNWNPSDAELVAVIYSNAKTAGLTLDEIRGLLLAENANGILRANCPRWLRRTQYFLGLHGKLYPDGLVARASAQWLEIPEHAEEMGIAEALGRHRGAKD